MRERQTDRQTDRQTESKPTALMIDYHDNSGPRPCGKTPSPPVPQGPG